ncbi:uroporphyrinogen-III synthase [Vibrio renipiscarius]|uniref:Uroporphyrinogen-III synthase n=1 Tax=Vibrio renipiscarius TaxID=1461322 RepID=A0A0C2P7M9_9VIBR|nr:uroporphyrinogen-III synthase [Vibrio renipiscarius]KII80249.1 uroporphyrinogen-III synthase [Vibrio renipiscarius]KII82487.1 uroporphyrinogen-III synthase [Vibrio renipiscarius]
MTVLVTRPGEQGEALCQLLHLHGIEALHHPLITIQSGEQLSRLPEQILNADIIIAVSQHAVIFANKILSQTQDKWPQSKTYLAVGQKTAHYLGRVTQQNVHYPEVSDSEHLLRMTQLSDVAGQQILILRGNGGRELIFDTLVGRKARVGYCEVYKRENLAFRSELTVPFWQDKHVKQLVITSSGQLDFFIQQIAPQYQSWLQQLTLFVPSARIAHEARRFGFHSVVNTGSASNQDLLATLWPNKQDENNDK